MTQEIDKNVIANQVMLQVDTPQKAKTRLAGEAANPLADRLVTILSHRRRSKSAGNANFVAWLKDEVELITGRALEADTYGNLSIKMTPDPILWTAHMDTVHVSKADETELYQAVETFRFEGNEDVYLGLPAESDSGCLGADDGVGLECLLYVLEHNPIGTFLFTNDEEVGLIGAKAVDKAFLADYQMALEIDRRGTDEVLWVNAVGECASEKFAETLAEQLGMGHEASDMGVCTDICAFADVVPECVNIAAGYYNEHQSCETVNYTYVCRLREALCAIDFDVLLDSVSRTEGDFGAMTYWWDEPYYDVYGSRSSANSGRGWGAGKARTDTDPDSLPIPKDWRFKNTVGCSAPTPFSLEQAKEWAGWVAKNEPHRAVKMLYVWLPSRYLPTGGMKSEAEEKLLLLNQVKDAPSAAAQMIVNFVPKDQYVDNDMEYY